MKGLVIAFAILLSIPLLIGLCTSGQPATLSAAWTVDGNDLILTNRGGREWTNVSLRINGRYRAAGPRAMGPRESFRIDCREFADHDGRRFDPGLYKLMRADVLADQGVYSWVP